MPGTRRIAHKGLCKTGLASRPPPPPKVAGVGFLPLAPGQSQAAAPSPLPRPGSSGKARRALTAASRAKHRGGGQLPSAPGSPPPEPPLRGAGRGGEEAPPRQVSLHTPRPRPPAPPSAAPSRRYLFSLGEVEPEAAPGPELLPLAEVEAHLGAGVSRHQRRAIPRQGVLLGAGGRHGSGGTGAKERSRPPAAGDKGRAAAPPRRREERPAPGAEDGGAPWREEAAPGVRGTRWRREETCRKPRALNA